MSSSRRFSLKATRSRKSEDTSPEVSPTIPTKPLFKHKRALVPYDGSEEAHQALNFAAELYQPGDHVVVAYIMPPGSPKSPLLSLDDAEPNSPLEKIAMEALERACEPLKAKGITSSCQVMQGDPKSSVQGLLDFHRCDTVIVGRRRVAKKMLLGQRFSTYVVEHTDANVITVR